MSTRAVALTQRALFHSKQCSFNSFKRVFQRLKNKRHLSSKSGLNQLDTSFGLLFDIDGVIVRGQKLLPKAREAFRLLTNEEGKFWLPTIFVTNAGNSLREKKAKQLSDWLDVEISPEQVILSHSPLKMFKQFHDKHVLVAGQGPYEEIARRTGFTKVTSMDTLRQSFPLLDFVDHNRRKVAPCAFEKYFPKIEAVILFGEPVRWETSLQLIVDILLSSGKPDRAPRELLHPHIPVLACNIDLLWMAEAPMPRFGHGCFLLCLEALYQKLTGQELKYTALIGKPSEITYHHSEYVLQEISQKYGLGAPKRLYCIGDNPASDIYGANLYNRYLQAKAKRKRKVQKVASNQKLFAHGGRVFPAYDNDAVVVENGCQVLDEEDITAAESCESILVSTGVYNSSTDYSEQGSIFNHNHRDFTVDEDLKKPTYKVHNVLDAVQLVFEQEGIL